MDHEEENPGESLAALLRQANERKRVACEEKMKNAPPPSDEPEPSDGGDDAPVERKKPPSKRHTGLSKAPKPPHKGGRFVMIYDHDANLILGCGDKAIASKTLAVWYTLVKRAEDEKSLTFDLPDGYFATTIPGMKSRHTVRKVTALLHSLGLLESASSAITGVDFRTPLRRTIHPAGNIRGFHPEEPNPFA